MLIDCTHALPARLETRRALAESCPLCGRTEHRVWAIIPSLAPCATDGGSLLSYRGRAFSLCSLISSSLFCSYRMDWSAEREGLEEGPTLVERGACENSQLGRPGASQGGREGEPAPGRRAGSVAWFSLRPGCSRLENGLVPWCSGVSALPAVEQAA